MPLRRNRCLFFADVVTPRIQRTTKRTDGPGIEWATRHVLPLKAVFADTTLDLGIFLAIQSDTRASQIESAPREERDQWCGKHRYAERDECGSSARKNSTRRVSRHRRSSR